MSESAVAALAYGGDMALAVDAYHTILPGFAALDLGATKIFAAAAQAPVKVFGTFTADLRALCAWLKERAVHSVAMEATGVYWVPVHDQLQADGSEQKKPGEPLKVSSTCQMQKCG